VWRAQGPLDYTRPEEEQIRLRVARARLTEQIERIGSLIHNPGGLGVPGVDEMTSVLVALPESVLHRFDVVTMDPRGTGGSAPFNCPGVGELGPGNVAPDILTETGFASAIRLERQRADNCLRTLGHRAPYFSTAATAADLDRLRTAVGDEELTYLGQSYGAKLGAEYAHRFPKSVRAAVLDAPSEPSDTLFRNVIQQAEGFEEVFDEYAQGCPSRPDCQLSADPRAFVTALVRDADLQPIVSTARSDHTSATGSDILATVRGALYSTERWTDLDEVLYEAHQGDARGIFAMGRVINWQEPDDSAPTDPADANYVINCNDSATGITDEQIRIAARQLAQNAPLFGRDGA
jgi:pimeloyl-ACP methyl ester carboxylesterase